MGTTVMLLVDEVASLRSDLTEVKRDLASVGRSARSSRALASPQSLTSQVTELRAEVARGRESLRDVVLVIIDELQLARNAAEGMDKLPPLNFTQCMPSFFNNPDFQFGSSGEGEEMQDDDESPGEDSDRVPSRQFSTCSQSLARPVAHVISTRSSDTFNTQYERSPARCTTRVADGHDERVDASCLARGACEKGFCRAVAGNC
jgi:hypothetical protein